MSKSLIFTSNTSSQSVNAGSAVVLGSVVHRNGCNCYLLNNSIQCKGQGIYSVKSSITLSPTATGNVSVSIYKDGNALAGATATETIATAGDTITLNPFGLFKIVCPCQNTSSITLVVSGASSVSNVVVEVEKI